MFASDFSIMDFRLIGIAICWIWYAFLMAVFLNRFEPLRLESIGEFFAKPEEILEFLVS